MSNQKKEVVTTFRGSRKVMKQARDLFEPLREVVAIAKQDGIGVKSHAGMVALDTLSATECYKLQERHGPEILDLKTMTPPIETMKRQKSTSLSEYVIGLELEPTVEVYEDGSKLVLGIPIKDVARDIILEDREALSIALSVATRTSIILPEDDEYYLTVGLLGDETTADQAGLVADEIEGWWENAAELTTDLYDLEVYDTVYWPTKE